MKTPLVSLAVCALSLPLLAADPGPAAPAAPGTPAAGDATPAAAAGTEPEAAPADEAAALKEERARVLKTLRESSVKTMQARSEAEKNHPELAAKAEEIRQLEARATAAREEYRAIAEALPELRDLKAADEAAFARLREIDARLREIDPSALPPVRNNPQARKPPRTFERPRPSKKNAPAPVAP